MIDKESYKTGKGELKTKRFLLLVSALFALKEKTKIPDALAKVSPLEIAKKIEALDNKLNITRKLQGVVVSIIEKKVNPDDYYYVLELTVKDDGKSNIKIMSFKVGTDSLDEDFYRFREQETQNLKNVSVLMIRSDKFINIKSEYPNYFLDTQKFIKELKDIIEKVKEGKI